jgi:ATP10 protein
MIRRILSLALDSGMRRGTPKADHENVITVYGGTETWKERIGVKAEDSAYLVIIDQKGKVGWRHAGPYEESSYQALAVQVRQLASAQ